MNMSMFFGSVGGWLIVILNLAGYFVFRFGMVSRGASRQIIQFSGGCLILISFLLMFIFFGILNGLILIPVFWFLTTPIVEIPIRRIEKAINAPYEEAYRYLARKYNTTPEEVKKKIYEDMGKSDDEIAEDILREYKLL